MADSPPAGAQIPESTLRGAVPRRDGHGDGAGPPAPPAPTRGRRIVVMTLIWVTSVLAVVGIFAVWANRQMLNPTNWSDTSTKLLQNAEIREATSNYLVDQLYANVDVEKELKAKLPANLQLLAGPISGGLRNVATEVSNRVLANPGVQELWRHANYAANRALVTIVEGGRGPLHINGGEVTLDLAAIVANISNRLGLPNVSSRLPPTVAQLKVLKSKQLEAVQKVGKAIKGLALLFTILVPVLYALAVLLAGGFRRRTLMRVGVAIASVGIVVFAARALLISQVTDSVVKTEAAKPAAHAVLTIGTSMLAEIAGAFIIVGVPLIAAAWFAGPARLATRGRREIAPFLREQAAWTYGIVAAIMLLIFIWNPIPATGKPAGIIVFFVLALFGAHVLRRQTASEFPAERPAVR